MFLTPFQKLLLFLPCVVFLPLILAISLSRPGPSVTTEERDGGGTQNDVTQAWDALLRSLV